MKNFKLFTGLISFLFIVFSACDTDDLDDFMSLSSSDNSFEMNAKNDKTKGFDAYGYNWNAHQFNGYLVNAWVGDTIDPTADYYHWEPYTGDAEAYVSKYPDVVNQFFWGFNEMTLVMHWNEALISGEGVYPPTWIDTDAWITFHYRIGEGENKWAQFQKMVAVKSTDTLGTDGVWYDENGAIVGYYNMWPGLALIQVVNTGNVPGYMFPTYKSPMSPGLGNFKLR